MDAKEPSYARAAVDAAASMAARLHRGQKDKGGNDYFTSHLLNVSAGCRGWKARCTALLHDAAEDTDVSEEEIVSGLRGCVPQIPEAAAREILHALKTLNSRTAATRDEYIARFRGDSLAIEVKLSDLRNNMDLSRIPAPSERDFARAARYRKEYETLKTMQEDTRLSRIVDFCTLIDKEKFITRRTWLTGGERLENDSEHAWHMAVMALLLGEYSNSPVDLLRVISILLIHDLVEIYAGDTFAYDQEAQKTQKQRENAAADALFSRLPDDLAQRMRSLWDEFEEASTPESRFAHTLDNFQPLMLQSATDGKSWRESGRLLSEVLRRNASTADGSEALWDYAREHFIRPQIAKGHLVGDADL